ncbi:RNA-binding protein [Candidatus Woesearchaeota archaeon]|nr:RNA-binding protein [Candidatus Woesearchaeota archaeon]
MKVTTVSPKDAQELLARYNLIFTKKDIIQRKETLPKATLTINRTIAFFFEEETAFPTLRFLMNNTMLVKKITVDMGAVRFIVNGADLMRPGIVAVDEEVKMGDPVVIVDQTHGKFLAVGKALFGKEEMLATTTGKMVKTLHYVGDELWKQEA